MNDKNEIIEEADTMTETAKNENEYKDVDEVVVEEDNTPQKTENKKIKKHQEALRLVEEAKVMVKNADEQTEACKLLLVGDLKEYEDAKVSLKRGGLDVCSELVEKLGYQTQTNEPEIEENTVVFEAKEEISPMHVKNVSSGKFTGFFYSLVGGAVIAVGLTYLATEKLGITLDISKVPQMETVEKIMTWFSSAVGLPSSFEFGVTVFALAVLLVMLIIYLLRVSMKGNKNLKFASQQYADAELYTEQKGHCKEEMDKVDAHMKDTVSTLKMYEVLFNEQKGKLERILHIEGMKEKSTEYHQKSFAEIRETKELIRTIKDFIATPMSNEGKLSEKSELYLQRAKTQMDKMLERLY